MRSLRSQQERIALLPGARSSCAAFAALALAACGSAHLADEPDPVVRFDGPAIEAEPRPLPRLANAREEKVALRWAPARTIVTLSFDDGLASQRAVPAILAPWGFRASFFVCTGRLGRPGHLDWDAVYAIAAAGHEIGGHTLDHDELTALSDEDARAAVCVDRLNLDLRGFAPISFAYPSSGSDDRVAAIVAECGYLTARTNKGLASADGTGCSRCPTTESIPPADPLQARSLSSVPGGATAADLQAWVLAAEEEGGWINLTFHEVLADCAGDAYCIETDQLVSFVRWLATRRPHGTVVRTQAEALGAPSVAAPSDG